MNISKSRFIPVFGALFLLVFLANPSAASAMSVPKPATAPVLHTSSVNPQVSLLDSSFNPSTAGGAPFCSSGSLGTILCYPPSFIKKAYNFPATTGHDGLDGTGQTIVLVDAFGSPTIQSDLNTFDAAFGLPATTVTILCGPTWTDASGCPLKTIADIAKVDGSPAGKACGGAEGWISETTLDVTMAHALAPGAHLVLLVANDCFDVNLYAAEMAIISQHAYRGSILSQSFGEPDNLVTCTALDPTNTFCVTYDNSLLNNCNAPVSVNIGCPNKVFEKAMDNHWTVLASSGDWGANTAAVVTGDLSLTPSFPSTSPIVLAAGGTQGSPYGGQFGPWPGPGGKFTCPAGKDCNTGLVVINGGENGCTTTARPGVPSSCVPVGYGGESSWQEVLNFGAVGYTSGGGISMLYDVPQYQKQVSHHDFTTLLGNQVEANGRMTPDVSFNSAVYGGVMAYLGYLGRWAVFGGTSAASPAWAGIIALLDQANGRPVGFVNPAIYSLAAASSEHGGNGANEGGDHGDHGNGNPFHDITTGNNAICSGTCGEDGYLAGRGYDLTTGWGTPNVSAFIQGIQQLLHGEGGE